MLEKSYTKSEWDRALRGLRDTYRLYVPVKDGDFHSFSEFEAAKAPDFNYGNTRLSPKGIVFPQSERMFEYSLDEKEPHANIYKEIEKDCSPKAIVGIRPCDAQAFDLVRRNFDTPEYRDPWWMKGYESTTLVGLGCNEPCPTCFCTSVGGGPFNEQYLDVLLWDLGEGIVARALTEKGKAFLDKAEGGRAPGDDRKKERDRLSLSAEKKIACHVATDKLNTKVANELFDAPFWEEVSFACINCGTCTFLCPTCWCFDIQDEVMGKEGERMRNWDSCMFPLFTLHGSGHNPREKKAQRVRQRFMHKLKYYVDKYRDGVQCSGCGRCVRYCPVNIDIRQVAELMNGY